MPEPLVPAEGERTESICPLCFKKIPAYRTKEGDSVYLEKQCPEDGSFKTILWRGSPGYDSWKRPKQPMVSAMDLVTSGKGCPYDCGICPQHGQKTCTALVEVTTRCNLGCRICFASAGTGTEKDDPTLEKIGWMYDRVVEKSGPCNIQLSGGEPSIRDDLAEIIALGKSKGFDFIQLNTNGIRLGEDAGFVQSLKDAGLASVFLQFDGISEQVHQNIRGRNLRQVKEQAILHCRDAGLGVVLVPTVIPGINDQQFGEILEYGLNFSPTVRGVHFQPISYFGRYPEPPLDENRITLPEVLDRIAQQTEGAMSIEDFAPPACEHERCSFHAKYLVNADQTLTLLSPGKKSCCTSSTGGDTIPTALAGREKSVSYTARQWAAPPVRSTPGAGPQEGEGELDVFLRRAKTHIFSVSGMAFQDAWNLDLERLQGCCIHVVSPDGRIIPFCAYNLTSCTGKPLHRKP